MNRISPQASQHLHMCAIANCIKRRYLVNVFASCLAVLLLMAAPHASGDEASDNFSLHYAASQGDIDKIKALLDSGAKIDSLDFIGTTPLYSAAYGGKTAAVQLLLGRGADVNAGKPGNSLGAPFQGALGAKNFEIAKLMLTSGHTRVNVRAEAVFTQVQSLLDAVVDTDNIDLLKAFLDHAAGINPNEENPLTGWTSLDSAIIGKKFEAATILVTKLKGWHFEPNKTTRQTTVDYAIANGTPELLDTILTNVHVDLSTKNSFGLTALDEAANNPAMLQVLVKHAQAH